MSKCERCENHKGGLVAVAIGNDIVINLCSACRKKDWDERVAKAKYPNKSGTYIKSNK